MKEPNPAIADSGVSIEQSDVLNRSLLHAARDQSLASLAQDTAHDLRGALNIISMNVELLVRAADAGSGTRPRPASARQSADSIRREVGRLDRLLDVLLGVYAIERDSPQTFDVAAVCERLLELVAARASRQRVHVTYAAPRGGAEIHGFPGRFNGALLSLLVNALDAMPDGGRLDVTVSRAGGVRIQLRDSGSGIPADRLADIWKLHFTTNTRGIGPHVARSVIESHGGTIHYEPSPEGGSCFVIQLPPAGQH